jgi:hypothetical protein
MWITDGDRPLPERIVLTYPNAPGQPQFRAQFSAWNLAPELADTLFTFTPPSEASRILCCRITSVWTTRASSKKGKP